MKPLTVKQFHASFTPAQWDGINRSGIKIVGKCVLVLMDEASGQSSGQHGKPVELPEGHLEGLNAGCISGMLVAVAEGAFCVNEDGSAWAGEKPKPGERVKIAKYAGERIPGRDGREYRMMDYGCIAGVWLSDAEYEAFIAAEEKRLGINPKTTPDDEATTAIGLIDCRCAELNIPQADGPAAAYFETSDGERHPYVSYRVHGQERADAERGLAAVAIKALEPDKVLVWRCRPEIEEGPDRKSGFYGYCRFAQVERDKTILQFGKDGFFEPPAAAIAGPPIQTAESTHEWDGEDLRCKHCRVKFVDVVDGKASRECAGEPQQVLGAARAA